MTRLLNALTLLFCLSLAAQNKPDSLVLSKKSDLINYYINTVKTPKVGIQHFEAFMLKTKETPNSVALARFYVTGSDAYFETKQYQKSLDGFFILKTFRF